MNVGGVYMGIVAANELKKRFVERGAISPETALTREELGVRKKPIFEVLVLKHHIIKVGDDKYYFDIDNYKEGAIEQLHNFIADLVGLNKSDSGSS